jgi:hypothetical protein
LRDDGIGLDEVLMLRPTVEGTDAKTAASQHDIKDLLDGGLTLADVVVPRTRPVGSTQLSLFGDAM